MRPTSTSRRALFEYDPATTAQNGQGTGAFAAGTVVAAVLATQFLAPELGIHPAHFLVTGLTFGVRMVVLDAPLYSSGRVFEPGLWWLRGLGSWSTLLATASYAAPSSRSFPPTWSLTLITAVLLGTTVARPSLEWWLLIALSTVGYHLVAAPSPSLESTLAASAVGLLSGLMLTVTNRASRLTRSSRRASEASSELAAKASDEARRRAASMALHDGLSGLVFVARTRLSRAASLAEGVECVAALLEQGRLVLGHSSETAEQLSAHLVGLAREVPIHCRLDAAFAELELLERLDLRFIVIEQVTNALKHRAATALEVEVSVRRRRLARTTCLGPPVAGGQQTGQGLRNAELRAASWAGESRLELDEQRSIATAHWREPAWAVQRLSLLGLAVAALSPLAWVGRSSLVVLGFSGFASVATALVQVFAFQQLREARRLQAAGRQLRVEAALFEEEHQRELRATLQAVSAATSLKALQAAVDGFAGCVTRIMKELGSNALK